VDSSSSKLFPLLRIATKIHYGGNQNVIMSNLIEQPKWESVGSATSGSFSYALPGVWEAEDSFDRGIDLI
jgi:hypothetical protein